MKVNNYPPKLVNSIIKIELEKNSTIKKKLLPMLQTNKYILFYHTLANVAITLYGK